MAGAIAMDWRFVGFVNWPIAPNTLAPHVPDQLELDQYDDTAWLSMVPFTNRAVRPRGLPRRLGFALPELNLRTYVTHDDVPGVYFLSLDADGILGVVGARLFHHLPYYYAAIDLAVTDATVAFTSQRRHPGSRPAKLQMNYRASGSRIESSTDPLATFLTDRYRYYTEGQDGTLRYADVQHGPWPLYPATVDIASNTLLAANQLPMPTSAGPHFYSPGVDTIASSSRRLSSDGTGDHD